MVGSFRTGLMDEVVKQLRGLNARWTCELALLMADVGLMGEVPELVTGCGGVSVRSGCSHVGLMGPAG